MWRVLICICSGQRSSSAPAFHISLHGPRWAAWPPPTACFMTSSAAALPPATSCVFLVFYCMWWVVLVNFWKNVCWWCIYQEVHFFIVDFDCWCFPLIVVKRTFSNRHGDHSDLQQWWRSPDPHFIDLCVMVAPVPRLVWAANLIKCYFSEIAEYDQIFKHSIWTDIF